MKKLFLQEIAQSPIFKYLISGGTAATVQYTILIGLVEVFNVNPFIATFIGLTVATFVNYPLQYYWTFINYVPHCIAFPKYVLVTSVAYTVNLFSFWFLEHVVGTHYIIAQIVATSIALAINFIVNSRYTFCDSPQKIAEHP